MKEHPSISEAFEKETDPTCFCSAVYGRSLCLATFTATANHENSIMFSLHLCLLAAMAKITLQLSFASETPRQSLRATPPRGAAAPEYCKQERDGAICYQESPNEGRAPRKGSELLLPTPAKQPSV